MNVNAARGGRGRGGALLSALLFAAEASSTGSLGPPSLYADESEQREEAFQARMTARVIIDRAFFLAQRGDFQRAINLFSNAIEFDPSYAPAFYYRAGARLQMRDFAGAIPDLDRVVELDPNYPAALNDRGFARWQIGDPTGGLADFDRCIALETNWGLLYANRAAVKAMLGDMAGAIADLDEAVRLDPSLASPHEQPLAVPAPAH